MTNIVLSGFMGTGKSTVGKCLARLTGSTFLDLDEVIEREAGFSISGIFAASGEARFREMEADTVTRLCAGEFGDGLVVSTGGGVVVDPALRAALKSWGVLVCLTASVDEILRRVGRRDDRPLLNGPDPRERVERLLEERATSYADCHLELDTTSLGIEEAAIKIREFAEAR